jgi:hypothetical protein
MREDRLEEVAPARARYLRRWNQLSAIFNIVRLEAEPVRPYLA